MKNLQQYLNQQYSTPEVKEKVEKIFIRENAGFQSNLPLTEEQAKEIDGGELDLSEYPNLDYLWIDGKYLKSPLTKSELGKKEKLTYLAFPNNKLTSLDVSNCPILENLLCSSNQLTSLDLSDNSSLESLHFSDNQLTNLDASNLPNLTYLYCRKNQLTNLDLSNNIWLNQIDCSRNKITNLNIQGLSSLQWLACYNNPIASPDLIDFNSYPVLKKEDFQWTNNAQEYLEWAYPQERRESVTYLDFFALTQDVRELQGNLKLEGFVNLKTLNCDGLQLTHLGIINCPLLKEIYCGNNQIFDINGFSDLETLNCQNNLLSNLDLSQSRGLKSLSIGDNNFPEQDLSFLNHLVNLEEVWLGNGNKEKVNQGIYNRFTGSLEPLQNMSRLWNLNISNTDIDSGLEYSPDSIEYFLCSSDERTDAKVKVIEQELRKFGEPGEGNNFADLLKLWKEASFKRAEVILQQSKKFWVQKINDLKWKLGVASELLKEGVEWENKLNSRCKLKEVEEYAKEILRNIYEIANKETPVDLQKLEAKIETPLKVSN